MTGPEIIVVAYLALTAALVAACWQTPEPKRKKLKK